MSEWVVYALCEPGNSCSPDKVRYIGKTGRFQTRMWEHRNEARVHSSRRRTSNWIRSISPLPPTCYVLEVFASDKLACEGEIRWIEAFKWLGADLTNHASGGQGSSGWHHSLETVERLRAYATGRKRSLEAVAKTAAAHRGSVRSDETRARISKSRKNYKWSEETRLKMTQGERYCDECGAGPFLGGRGIGNHKRKHTRWQPSA